MGLVVDNLGVQWTGEQAKNSTDHQDQTHSHVPTRALFYVGDVATNCLTVLLIGSGHRVEGVGIGDHRRP